MTELISIRECARRIGVSDTAVHKAIKSQRVTIAGYTEKSNRPLLEWPQVAEDWAANSDPMKRTHIGGDGNNIQRAKYATTPAEVSMPTRADTLEVKDLALDIVTELEILPVIMQADTIKPEIKNQLIEFKIRPQGRKQESNSQDEDVENISELSKNPTIAESRQVKEAYVARLAKLDFEEKSGKLIPVEKVKADAFKAARSVRDALLNIPDRVAHELAAESDPSKIHARLIADIRDALESLAGIPE